MARKPKGKSKMKEAMEEAVEKKAVEQTEAAEAAGQEVQLKNYKVMFSYVTSDGKRVDHASIVKDCRNTHDAKQIIFEQICKAGLDGELVTFDDIHEADPAEVEEATPKEETLPMFEEDKQPEEQQEENRKTTFIGRIANTSVKNGTVRLLKITMECVVNVPNVTSELLDKYRSNEDLYITVEPYQLTAKDVHPNKKFKEDVETGEEAAPSAPAAETVTEEYACPFCVCPATITYEVGQKPQRITCEGCGREFPIEFQDELAEEPGSSPRIEQVAGMNAIVEDFLPGEQ